MDSLQPFDIFVVVLCILMALWGGIRGLFSQLISIVSLVASWYVSTHYYEKIFPYIPLSDDCPWKDTVAMVVIFFLVSLLIHIIGHFIGGILKHSLLSAANRQVGAIVGLIKGIIICMIVTFFAVTGNEKTCNFVVQSVSGKYLIRAVAEIQNHLPEDESHEKVREALAKFNETAEKNGVSTKKPETPSSSDSDDKDGEKKSSPLKQKISDWFRSVSVNEDAGGQNPSDGTGSSSSNNEFSDIAKAGQILGDFESLIDKYTTHFSSEATTTTPSTTGQQSSNSVVAVSSSGDNSSGSILNNQTFDPSSVAPSF